MGNGAVMLLPLILLAESAMFAPPQKYEFRNWQISQTGAGAKQSCAFALSPNFYGIVVRYDPANADFQIEFDSPAVHVLPVNAPIPLKIDINGEVQSTIGHRVDRKLYLRIAKPVVEAGMRRKGMIRVFLSDPSIKETLIARYRMQGSRYEASFRDFQACRTSLVTPPQGVSG